MITSLVLKTIRRSNKNKKENYASTNVSLKDISNIIKEFEKFPFEGYVRKRSKHKPTDIYWKILAKCMMRLNPRVGPVRKKRLIQKI